MKKRKSREELCPTKAEMKRIDNWLKKHTPKFKKGTKRLCMPVVGE